MREILFRGKDTSGKWHYGVPLMFNEDYVCIAKLNEHNKTVEYKTLGQYTGLTDKNGKKIFEGDIVKREYTLWHSETKKTRETQIGVVSYSNKECGFCLDKVCNLRKPWDGDTLEIIGNIHDNKLEDF